MKKIVASVLVLSLILLITGCTTTSVDCDYNGMHTTNGKPIAHVNTSSLAVTLFGYIPLMGDPNLKHTFNSFITETKRLNASKVDVDNSTIYKNWWSFIPITWIFVPVVSEVSGTAYQ